MKFSLIIPVFNVESYIEKTIESILDQDYYDFEVIFVDDGSTDASIDICRNYQSLFMHSTIISQNNAGLSAARNTGIMAASGEYLIFIDSDDWLIENALSSIDSLTSSNEPDIVISRIKSYDNITGKTTECNYYFNVDQYEIDNVEKIFSYCYSLNGFWAAAWMFCVKRTLLINKNLYFMNGVYHEDEEWAPRLLLSTPKVVFNNICVYINRCNRTGSIIATPNIKKEFDKLKIVTSLIKESKRPQYSKYGSKLLQSRCSCLIGGIIVQLSNYKNDPFIGALLYEIKINLPLLWHSKRLYHKMLFCFCYILGPLSASSFIQYYINKKR